MLVWDETDVLTVLEAIPDVEPYGIYHKFSVHKDRIELRLCIFQFDGDVSIELFGDDIEDPVFSMKLVDCTGVRRIQDQSGEYLEFAPAKCFGSRYDGISKIPFGVHIHIKPTISVSLYG
ncbi:hypothetical protein [uncultured Kiloniella sp.]|uniref:hypothetical protein n=1 Tax=uncultured Kiloniella sp. TaxID=1133091 RepID=UPI0026269ED4|nr:hypothetical protein [uncultured Kiloniella sp.]